MRFLRIGLYGALLAAGSVHAEIRVRIQDYANVPPATLTIATTFASGVLERAGVKVVWAICPPHSPNQDRLCDIPLGPLEIYVRILNREMARRTNASRHSVGYAMLAGRFPSIADVFHHRVVELETGNPASRAGILGAVIVHEIGHLLLNRNHHSRSGILQAHWNDRDFKLIAQGTMWFTPEEARRMVSLVAERRRAATNLVVTPLQRNFVETGETAVDRTIAAIP